MVSWTAEQWLRVALALVATPTVVVAYMLGVQTSLLGRAWWVIEHLHLHDGGLCEGHHCEAVLEEAEHEVREKKKSEQVRDPLSLQSNGKLRMPPHFRVPAHLRLSTQFRLMLTDAVGQAGRQSALLAWPSYAPSSRS